MAEEHTFGQLLMLRVAASLLSMSVIGFGGLLVGTPGFWEVFAEFNWHRAVRAFANCSIAIGVVTVFVSFLLMVDKGKESRSLQWKVALSSTAYTVFWIVLLAGISE